VLAHPPGYQRHINPIERKSHVSDIKHTDTLMRKTQPISERIKAARQKLNLSQADAAKKWKFSVRTLQGYEIGRPPRGLYLEKLEAILKKAGV